jgi:5-methylcytosine-specific restriction endonuclease McrA
MVDGCGTPATTVDHVVPLALGGAMYDPDNLRAACAAHNASAGASLPRVPARDLGSPSRRWVS